MENKTEFEYRGLWWTPEHPHKKFPGTLRYSQVRGISLEIEKYDVDFIDLKKSFDRKSIKKTDILLGETIDGKKITLLNCFETFSTINLPKRKRSIFYVEKILIGYHFEKMNHVRFKKVLVHFINLDEWINIHGFKIKFSGKKKIKFHIDYKIPKSIQTKVNKDFVLRIVFEVSGPSISMVQKEACIKQKIFLEIESRKKEKKLEDFLKTIKVFQDFLTFAIQTTVYPNILKGYAKSNKIEINDKMILNPIEIINSPQIIEFKYKPVLPFQMFFSFKDIYPEFKRVIKKWFNLYESFEAVLQLYFAQFYNPKLYLEYNFLSLVYAIEGYHRRKFKGVYIDRQKYEKTIYKLLIHAIPPNIDNNFKKSLESKLQYGNEYSLIRRFKDIIRFISDVKFKRLIKNKNRFINSLKNTRNYLVHQDKSLEKNAAKGKDLYFLTLQTRFIFEICLLKELGLNPNKIDDLISQKVSLYNLDVNKNEKKNQ